MLNLLKKLSIDETFTKPVKESKKFHRVKDNIPLVENYNYMADILILPKTKKGFISLFCLSISILFVSDSELEYLN